MVFNLLNPLNPGVSPDFTLEIQMTMDSPSLFDNSPLQGATAPRFSVRTASWDCRWTEMDVVLPPSLVLESQGEEETHRNKKSS